MQIERVLSQHKLPGQVEGGMVKQQAIHFDLHLSLTQGLERLKGLKNELARSLGGAGVKIRENNGRFNVEVAHHDELPVPLLDLLNLIDTIPPETAVLGLAEDERPVLLTLAEGDMTHIFVAGGKGSGKTTLLRTMAISLAYSSRQSQLQLVIIYPNGMIEGGNLLEPLNYLPHMLANAVSEQEEAVNVIEFLLNEMNYRLEQQIVAPRIVILIDGIEQIVGVENKNLQQMVSRLLQQGAEAGIHLIVSTENPEADTLASWMKSDFSVRIVGQVDNARLARVASGVPDTQAEYLLGSGDFLAVGNGVITRFQGAAINDYDFHLMLAELHHNRPPALLAQAVNAHPVSKITQENSESEKERPFLFDGQSISLPTKSETAPVPRPQIRLGSQVKEV